MAQKWPFPLCWCHRCLRCLLLACPCTRISQERRWQWLRKLVTSLAIGTLSAPLLPDASPMSGPEGGSSNGGAEIGGRLQGSQRAPIAGSPPSPPPPRWLGASITTDATMYGSPSENVRGETQVQDGKRNGEKMAHTNLQGAPSLLTMVRQILKSITTAGLTYKCSRSKMSWLGCYQAQRSASIRQEQH